MSSTVLEVLNESRPALPAHEMLPEQEGQDSDRCICPLIGLTPYPMWIFDRATLKFLEVNQAASSRYGYSRSEFLEMTILDIRPPEDVPLLLRNAVQHPAVSRCERWRHATRKGEIITVEISSREVFFHGRVAELVLAVESGTIAARQAKLLETLDVAAASTRYFCQGCTEKCSLAVPISPLGNG